MAARHKKLRVFVDANVLLAGNAFPRWPYEVLEHATDGDFKLVLCPLVILQAREHLRQLFPAHLDRFERFLREADYELVPDPSSAEIDAHSNLVRDVSDIPIAMAAMTAGVDYVVSEDKDLTAQDETTVELRRHLNVLLSGTFLRQVMGWTSEELEAIRHRQWNEMPEDEIQEPGKP
jgi:predicted nucleic acid-binding protein